MKKIVSCLLMLIATISAIVLSISFNIAGYYFAKAENDEYSLKMGLKQNTLTDSTSYTSGNTIVKTELGNDINIVYNDLQAMSSRWQVAKQGTGYFYNETPIHGLSSITLRFLSSRNTFAVYWSNSTTFSDEKSVTFTNTIGNQTCNFNNEMPSHFKVLNTSGVTIQYYDVVAKYSCLNSNPTLSISSENNTMGTVSGTNGVISSGSQATIVATPNNGYQFIGWYSGNTLISSSSTYVFTVGYTDMNYVAHFALANYNLVVISENNLKGMVSNSSGEYAFLSNVSISATPNNGYSFMGWYSDDNLVSTDNPYQFTIPSHDLTYVARFNANSYTLSLSSNNNSFGTVTGSGTYTYGTSVTAIATPNEGVTFVGWYDEGNNLVSNLATFTFDMPYNDYHLNGRFSAETYTLTVSSEDNNKGVTSGSGTKIWGSTVTARCVANGGRFKGWYDSSSNLVSVENPYSFKMPRKNYQLTAKFMSATELNNWNRSHGVTPVYDSNAKTITYGLYPQSHVTNGDLLDILNNLTETDINDWYLYNNEYYVKLSAWTANSNGSTFDDGTEILRNDIHWFKCEPITWNVLSVSSGNYYALSSVVLDGWYYVYHSNTTTIDNQTIYCSNYKYSGIRTWLNDTFYNSAFALANSSIQTTTVNNSAATTANSNNQYTCENTSDKVFLPSYKDYINSSYGFSTSSSASTTRQCKVSEYARADYTYVSNSESTLHNGLYLTRSPYSDSYVWCVFEDGRLSDNMPWSYTCGVRPAITLRIS